MDLFEDDGPAGTPGGDGEGNTPEFTVSELSGAVKRVIEGEFGFVRVRGELGRISRPRSGHLYLDLKDDKSVISGIVWRGVASKLDMQPEEGMEVIATGRLTTYPGQSRYQIIIEDMRPAGLGALMAMLEKRKAQLQAEGLFAPERKRPLPFLPEIIGVVTSPSGAVIRDILHRLRERFPRKVLIWPVAVQGKNCAPEVARAIEGFNALTPGGALPRPDLLIVARGGGSVEDLWGFNEEIVARAAAASQIPLISAVGHETDTTLIDFVSDKRAPTPTAAAEIAVPVRMDLLARAAEAQLRLTRAQTHRLEVRGQRLRDLARGLPRPEMLLDQPRQRLDLLADRLPQALIRGVDRRRLALSQPAGALRPGLLTRMMATRAEALGRRADRLSLRPIQREIALGGDRLKALGKRLEDAGARRVEEPRAKLDGLERLLQTLSYKGTLARGYAVVRGEGGQVLTTSAAAKEAAGLEIEFADGRMKIGGGAATPAKAKKAAQKKPEQGSLF
ncbi:MULTISPECIES: exodeoxyribonuclease VII large subunit [Roseobacteraceae]|uniref:exodeoxyribonuclease VII large subunit n=1 Tax=Roseobacteraceae TaxID=2854170 RepID=UPI0013B66719|nr:MULTISPECIES: exodeoxyribonuclease VII large subunit [Roseobacteraceae]MCA0994147.1 exodeoxyribonuclease VII large subunit [Alloyangia pacifica]NDW01772.1 exodeoxyribonuclease VII large subunit [Salipiger sp. PrR002]NDW58906.1 exodeoxyribonuclease VII large subunit [Salipiger sp. PrR004]